MGRIKDWFSAALEPEIDEARAGLGLIELLFGLALGLAFARTLNGYDEISSAGWAHLALAVTTIVLSWVGYHNTRQRGLWMMKFINRPFLQYLVDFLIVAAYWALVITAEGIPSSSQLKVPAGLSRPSIVYETFLLVIVFMLYFVWDLLEISINANARYQEKAEAEWPDDKLTKINAVHAGDMPRFKMTSLFLVIFSLLLAVAIGVDPSRREVVICWDVVLMLLLVAYRVAQTLWASPTRIGR